jgi:AraC family transcriptional regulator of adaptative response/methylated-DNA-[protein]-cysteine methyltransferase
LPFASRELRIDARTDEPCQTDLIEDEAATAEILAKIVELINDPRKALELPLDLQGSATELAVWESLRTIPAGETRSYGQIAKALRNSVTPQPRSCMCRQYISDCDTVPSRD